jgi:hypothetical protein
MKRLAVLVALGVTGLLMSVTASAATLPTGTTKVGGGSAQVSKCDPDGFTATSFATSGGKVTGVTVGGIAPECAGGSLRVNLTQGTASVAAGGPVTVTGTSHDVSLSGAPDAWIVDGFTAVVIGP